MPLREDILTPIAGEKGNVENRKVGLGKCNLIKLEVVIKKD